MRFHTSDSSLTPQESTIPLSASDLTAILESVLTKGVPCRFRANGGSMSPFVKGGDILTVAPMHGETPRVGNIVAFIHPRTRLVTVHRVVARRGESFRLKGDNTAGDDGLVANADVIGRIVLAERSGRSIPLKGVVRPRLIAILSHSGVLRPLLNGLRRLLRPGRKQPGRESYH